MKLRMNIIRFASGLTVWLLAVQPGQSFYNPQTGRWLSRDPLGESASPHPYSFVANTPVLGLDSLGLRLYPRLVDSWTVAQIQTLNPFVIAYTDIGEPIDELGEDVVAETLDNRGFCAQVVEAKELVQFVHTYIPNNPFPNPYFTPHGLTEIAGHEGRRVEIMRRAWAVIMAPAELTGNQTTKCNAFCCCMPHEARDLLLKYLGDLRKDAKSFYSDWVLTMNFVLSATELPLDQTGTPISTGGPTDHYSAVYTPRDPPRYEGPSCPSCLH